ncbi:MAG: M28 family peptidase [Bacteroidota bacterium]
MHKQLSILVFLIGSITLSAQDTDTQLPEFQLSKQEIRTQMEFLASDFLEGRRTASRGNRIAAEYIASHLRAYGYEAPEGAENYLQDIPFESSTPPVSYSMNINKVDFKAAEDFLILAGPEMSVKTNGIFAGHGWVDEETDHDDYAGLDVEGKVVFVLPGPPGAKDPGSIMGAMRTKRQLAEERGAAALIELYQLPFPWTMFANFFGGESLRVAAEEDSGPSKITYAWLNAKDEMPFTTIQSAKKLKVTLTSSGFASERVYSHNVIGVLEGTDPVLKDEYLLITAHYDHVGVGSQGGQYTPQDSIFNGARDNAFGTIAMLNTAKALAAERPKRSIIILAVTGEELGLLGSAYYADHPIIPLEKVIFNFNTDGAGYSETGAVSIFGWNRTGTNEMLEAGVKPFGFEIIPDPAPEQGLFDRSDNVSFARKGVPALTFSPGFREFDAEILQHYHQVTDEADSIDYDYLTKYCKAFAHCCRMIANNPSKPVWVAGDKYEEAGKELYGIDP